MDLVGVGVQAVATDKAEIRATVEYKRMINATGPALSDVDMANLVQSVQQEVSKRAAAVVTFLQKDPTLAPHISKLRTTGLALEPLNEWIENRQRLAGYRAANSITFRIDIDQAGLAIDGIVTRGVNRIDGLAFVASPKLLNAARHTAIMAAVEDAMDQALVSRRDARSQHRTAGGYGWCLTFVCCGCCLFDCVLFSCSSVSRVHSPAWVASFRRLPSAAPIFRSSTCRSKA